MTDLFHRHYDGLFASKGYKDEIDAVLSAADHWFLTPCVSVLEIGCGTGNHSLELAKRRLSLTAVDIDAQMVEMAKQKARSAGQNGIRFFRGDVEDLDGNDFDLAVALFNVVTYIPDTQSLERFFKAVRQRLRPGGGFIFDCWNGVAAIMQPPESKSLEFRDGNQSVRCEVTSETDFFSQKSILNYRIGVYDIDGREVESDVYSFGQTLWTPMQITDSLLNAGLEKIACCKLFEPRSEATHSDWKIMFACRNPLVV